jgi:hypothetical protein
VDRAILNGAAALAALLASCAPRLQLCAAPASCPEGFDCVAGMCQAPAPTSPLAGSRRLVLRPVAIAALRQGAPSSGGALPAIVTLGRARDGGAELLLRFDLRLDRSATLLRASVVLDRSDATLLDPTPVALHANRIISRWDEARVRWETSPAVQDARAPRTAVDPTTPRQIRIDVTDLARRWLAHDPADQGVAIVAENETPVGVSFVLGTTSLEPRQESAPRLELYVR